MSKRSNVIKYLTMQEKKSFFQELDDEILRAETESQKKKAIRNNAAFKVMYFCALRATEVSLLKTEFYNPYLEQLYCIRIKGGINNTIRIIDNDVLRSLKRHIRYNQPGKYLFEGINPDKGLSRKTLDYTFKKVCSQMNRYQPSVDRRHCHTLRHTRAINLADMGLDIKDVQYWLGHADVKNTMIYFEYTTRQQDALYRKIKRKEKNSL